MFKSQIGVNLVYVVNVHPSYDLDNFVIFGLGKCSSEELCTQLMIEHFFFAQNFDQILKVVDSLKPRLKYQLSLNWFQFGIC